MNLVKRKGQVVYEDLLRELEVIEHQLMADNSALAMSVMVLESKLRDRFQQLDENNDLLLREDMSAAELEALIPRDLPPFPDAPTFRSPAHGKTWETVGVAALLAVGTACGVFGLATALQVFLGWLA